MTRTPQLSIGLANYGATFAADEWRGLLDLGRAADDAGVDRIVVVDHVVMGPHTENYQWGKFPVPPEAPWFEPLSVLTRDRGRHDACAPRDRHPHRAAPPRRVPRQAGRDARPALRAAGSTSGVGTGWQREEYDARGNLTFEQRGQLLDGHARRRARCCGATRLPNFDGPTLSFRDIYCEPKPLQPGGVPLWIAGTLHTRNLERIVQHGDAWIPIMGETVAGMADGVRVIADAWSALGRDPSSLQVRGTLGIVPGDIARSMESVAGAARGRRHRHPGDAASLCARAGRCAGGDGRARAPLRRGDLGSRHADAVRRLSDPPDAAADRASGRAAIRITTTGSGSTATPKTSTSRRAWPCIPNRGIIDGAFAVVHDGVQRSVFASGRIPMNRGETRIGPLTIDVVEPLRVTRVRADAADLGIDADVTFTGRTVALEEPRQQMTAGNKVVMDSTRMTQWGTWSGRINAAGTEIPINAMYGTKDRSWGVRPIGAPAPAAPELTLPQIFFLWAPINWDDRCSHFLCFERGERRPVRRQPGGARSRRRRRAVFGPDADARIHHLAGAVHEVRWAPGLRRSQGATLRLAAPRRRARNASSSSRC